LFVNTTQRLPVPLHSSSLLIKALKNVKMLLGYTILKHSWTSQRKCLRKLVDLSE